MIRDTNKTGSNTGNPDEINKGDINTTDSETNFVDDRDSVDSNSNVNEENTIDNVLDEKSNEDPGGNVSEDKEVDSDKEDEIKKLKKEIESLKDILQRRQADFENYKKRMLKYQEEYKSSIVKDMGLEVITIHDDLLRAIDAASSVEVSDSIKEAHDSFVDGVSLIAKRIEEMLNKYNITEIESLDTEFDPNLNEAVEIEQSNDVDKDTITKVYSKGYVLGDQVVRSAKVRVTKPSPKENASEENAGPDENDPGEIFSKN